MTGREEPSQHSLRSELHKRLYLLESRPGTYSEAPVEARRIDPSGRHRTGHTVVGKGAKGARMTGAGNGTVAGGNATSAGVSPLDIQAAKNGGVTAARPPTVNDTLGLNIE